MLAFCDKCFKPTGSFNVLYEIPVPQKYSGNLYDNFSKGICLEEGDTQSSSYEGEDNCSKKFSNVIIYKRLKNKNEALSLQKNSISSLKGTIEKIIYKSDIDELHIYVK